ncbi:MAG: hypothetical protein ACW9W3_05805 [Candidatus Nitrosopumilus sp. bin_68KS]
MDFCDDGKCFKTRNGEGRHLKHPEDYFVLGGVADFVAHIIGIIAFVTILVSFWLYSQHVGNDVQWVLNTWGISLEILGFVLMLWAGTRMINLPKKLVESVNSDSETPTKVMGSPHPTTWAMGIGFIIMGLVFQLIASWI